MFNRLSITLTLLAGLAVAASAQNTMVITGIVDNTQSITINPGGSVLATPFTATLDKSGTVSNILVFCSDITDHTEFNSAPQAITIEDTLSLGANYQKAAQYYNYFAPLVGTDDLKNAALQVSIWNALYNVTFDETTTLGTLAESYINTDVSKASKEAYNYDFGGANQNMFGSAQAVPEPCSMLALGTGALALIRRRK